MPFNVPTVTTSDISFGPAVVFMGASGNTPSVDVGALSEDGVSIEITSEKKYISQGNPKMNVYNFSQAQGVVVKFTGIEWDFTNLAYALGAGDTTSSASDDTFSFGGDPICTEVAIHIQHYMAVSGNTMNAYIWKACSSEGVSMSFSQDEHAFEYSFTALRSTTDWGSSSLGLKHQLIMLKRLK